jgi:hypothetical protein
MDATKPVFVFGSNLAGRHGAGAALSAALHYGAVHGVGEGIQGQSYAIPTKDGRNGANLRNPRQILSLLVIKKHVDKFIAFAKKNPDFKFKVTAIGTGYSGYTHDDIAPLFYDAPLNCTLPSAWITIIPAVGRTWWIS